MSKINQISRYGTAHGARALTALFPDFAPVDERTIQDFFAFAANYAKLLNFYNQKNTIAGDWEPVFLKDVSILLATIGNFNILTFETKYELISEAFYNAHDVKGRVFSTRELIQLIVEIVNLLEVWYNHATSINAARNAKLEGIELELYNIIKLNLGVKFLELKSLELGLVENEYFTEKQVNINGNYHKIWGKVYEVAPTNVGNFGENRFEVITNTFKKIGLLFNSFDKALIYIIKSVPNYFEKSLNQSNHTPDVGLFITFLKLFKFQQDNLNKITEQHLNYYFLDFLKEKLRDGKTDKVHIYFELNDTVGSYYLPKNTALTAGKNEDNEDIIYTLDRAITLSQSRIAHLKTVFVSKNLLFGVGSSYRLVANIYKAEEAHTKDGFGKSFEDSEDDVWPTFGADQFDRREDEKNMRHANIGFALASPIFFLDEGERHITVKMNFTSESMLTLKKLLSDIAFNDKELSEKDVFQKVFKDSLDIAISGAESWIEIDRYDIFLPEDIHGTSIAVSFMLLPSEPAVVAYNKNNLGEDYITNWPLVKMKLRSGDAVYSYSFMRDLVLSNIEVDVEVKKLKNFDIYNDLGRLDSSKAFQPFGATPTQGTNLLIGKTELFKKNLTNISINIEWQNLPNLEGGFAEYYENYDLEVDNSTFKGRLSALSNGIFYPSDEGEETIEFSLFSDIPNDDGHHRIMPTTTLEEIPLDKLNIKPNYYLRRPEDYNHNTRNGFFKIELAAPIYGFGTDIYPRVFTKIVTENAQPPKRNLLGEVPKVQKEVPNTPYVPVIRALTMSYKANSKINLSSLSTQSSRKRTPEQIFHIHPFGKELTYMKGISLNPFMMPQYNKDGYLYIGIENMNPPEVLNLYFELVENNINLTGKAFRSPQISWSFLSKNKWIPLKNDQILLDTTLGFSSPGIIQLDIPNTITKNNTILSGACHWIRAAVAGDVEILSNVRLVTTQGSVATWQYNPDDLEHLEEALEKDKIEGFVESVIEISAIHQPYPSFGGKPKEKLSELYTRMSERLRHKNRGITAWDIEHVLLEVFSDLRQVKCFTNRDVPKYVSSGELLVVVIPKKKFGLNYRKPMVNYRTLQSIKKYINQYTSPFVDIKIINPIYEEVKISCDVIFTSEDDHGHLLKLFNEDVKHFLCPWLDNKDKTLLLGGTINKDSVLTFLEQLPYIRFVTRLSLVQVYERNLYYEIDDTALYDKDGDSIISKTPWSVLVPIKKHQVTILETEAYQPPQPVGLGTMSVEVDLIIKAEGEEDMAELSEEERIRREREEEQRLLDQNATSRFFLDIDL